MTSQSRVIRKSSRRGIATALALSCLLGPILAHAHLWLVQHARCVEHGELLHVAGSGTGAPVDESAVGESPAHDRTPSADAQSLVLSESHEHDHCVVASARKAQAPAVSDALSISPPPLARPPLLHLGAAPPPPLAAYVLAPKNSPPA